MNKPHPGQFKSFNNDEVWPTIIGDSIGHKIGVYRIQEGHRKGHPFEGDIKIFKFLRVLNTELVNKTRGIPHV